jgi:hypothetical protein
MSLILAWALASTLDSSPWVELSLSIEKDRYTSSDQVTLCRVRVRNHGAHTWPGRALRFEARAVDGGVVVARETGRFGLSLAPYGTLETLIAFPGRHERFEVEPLSGSAGRKTGDGRRKTKKRRG